MSVSTSVAEAIRYSYYVTVDWEETVKITVFLLFLFLFYHLLYLSFYIYLLFIYLFIYLLICLFKIRLMRGPQVISALHV